MKTGQNIYLRVGGLADSRDACPRRGLVVGVSEEGCAVALEGEGASLPPGTEVVALYQRMEGFVMQSARIESVDSSSASPIVDLLPLGDPLPAEKRRDLRFSALSAGAAIQVGVDVECRLQDVSVRGFAVATTEMYQVGDRLPAELTFENERYEGVVTVQNAHELWGHRIRYGMRCAPRPGDTLSQGLAKLTRELQRSSLRKIRAQR